MGNNVNRWSRLLLIRNRVGHLVAWCERETRCSWEEESVILFVVVVSLVDVWAIDHLWQDASHAPDVDCLIVSLLSKDNFWSSVPSWHNTVGQVANFLFRFWLGSIKVCWGLCFKLFSLHILLFWWCIFVDDFSLFLSVITELLFLICLFWHRSSKTEITNFDATIRVDKEITWLDVSVDDVCWVHEIDGTERIVQDGGNVIFRKINLWLWTQQFLHITFYQFHYDENMIEFLEIWSTLLDLDVVIELHDLIGVLVGIKTCLLCLNYIALLLVE